VGFRHPGSPFPRASPLQTGRHASQRWRPGAAPPTKNLSMWVNFSLVILTRPGIDLNHYWTGLDTPSVSIFRS
jgi:hypothetical protein